MCTCKNCRYGSEVIAKEEDFHGYFCWVTEEWFEMETALNNDLGCDLYVKDVDDDN